MSKIFVFSKSFKKIEHISTSKYLSITKSFQCFVRYPNHVKRVSTWKDLGRPSPRNGIKG